MEYQTQRRKAILLITLIAFVLLVYAISPLLVSFALGFALGGISAFGSVIYLLLKK